MRKETSGDDWLEDIDVEVVDCIVVMDNADLEVDIILVDWVEEMEETFVTEEDAGEIVDFRVVVIWMEELDLEEASKVSDGSAQPYSSE